MGRSSLQGTPWHYEYSKRESKSKKCAFNVGYCSNIASIYHGQKCVGKAECEEFERGSNIYIENYNEKRKERKLKTKEKAKSSKKKAKSSTNLIPQGKDTKKRSAADLKAKMDHGEVNKRNCVKPGDSITIEDIETNETINLDISDPKNPFVGKALSQSVKIQDVFYKVVRINEKKVDRKIK